MRNTQTYRAYSTNPYGGDKQKRSAMVYNPDDYTLSLLLSLSPKALRVLFVIAARVDFETGISYCPTGELRKLFNGALSNISAAKSELLRAKLVAYGKANHSFYVNPQAFKPITIRL